MSMDYGHEEGKTFSDFSRILASIDLDCLFTKIYNVYHFKVNSWPRRSLWSYCLRASEHRFPTLKDICLMIVLYMN
jgi:hypothetical protein